MTLAELVLKHQQSSKFQPVINLNARSFCVGLGPTPEGRSPGEVTSLMRWPVIGRPYATAGAKSTNVRVQRVDNPW